GVAATLSGANWSVTDDLPTDANLPDGGYELKAVAYGSGGGVAVAIRLVTIDRTPAPTPTPVPTATPRPTATPTVPPTGRYALSGRVATGSCFGLRGITVTLRDASGATRTTVAAANGQYSFGNVAAGSYQLTPSYPGLRFTPPTRSVPPQNADLAGLDFIATV